MLRNDQRIVLRGGAMAVPAVAAGNSEIVAYAMTSIVRAMSCRTSAAPPTGRDNDTTDISRAVADRNGPNDFSIISRTRKSLPIASGVSSRSSAV
jgi:hypothetical protein